MKRLAVIPARSGSNHPKHIIPPDQLIKRRITFINFLIASIPPAIHMEAWHNKNRRIRIMVPDKRKSKV